MRTLRGRNEASDGWMGPGSAGLDGLLEEIRAGAAARDAEPAFPKGPFRSLAAAGVLSLPVPERPEGAGRRVSFTEEWRVLRAVAAADGSVDRILDGHFNAVERLSILAPEPLRSRELAAVAAGERRVGVWGADPIPGEGEPARLVESGDGLVLRGVKTFCSGSTGLDRAIVLVRGAENGPPLLAYTDLSRGVEIDRGWFRGAGMRSSESHRVVFEGASVLAVLGKPGEILREPYFGRDAIRTAATWAGIADSALASWVRRNTFDCGDFDPAALAESKRTSGTMVSVILTMGGKDASGLPEALGPLAEAGLVDEKIVLCAKAGNLSPNGDANFYPDSELLPHYGPVRGYGDALWRGLAVSAGEILLFLDSTVADPDGRRAMGLLGPLLLREELLLVKGFSSTGFGEDAGAARGLSELVARPLINLYRPELAGFVDPVSAEFSARRSLLASLPFPVGYGASLSLLLDASRKEGAEALAQARLRQERPESGVPHSDLTEAAYAILTATMSRIDARRARRARPRSALPPAPKQPLEPRPAACRGRRATAAGELPTFCCQQE